MARNNNNQFGLIIIGNSGVGKSFLANILLGREAFKHAFAARSVTHITEFQEITIDDYDYAIFNIPGLIEADQTHIDMNKREIDRAFALRPNSLVIYVFGQQEGRIRNEDVVAFNAINKAYSLNIESLLLVVNGLVAKRPENYEGEAILLLRNVLNMEIPEERLCFLNRIDQKNIEERVALRNQLLSYIFKLSPREHIKQHDIHLQADEVDMLKAQIKKMTKEFEQNRIFFQNEIRAQQQSYAELVIQQKAESERFRHILDQQAEEAKKMKEMQEAQVREMQERMRQMQAEHQRLTQEMVNKSNAETALIRQALQASQQAQEQLRQQIISIQNRPPQVIYRTEGGGRKGRGCVIL